MGIMGYMVSFEFVRYNFLEPALSLELLDV